MKISDISPILYSVSSYDHIHRARGSQKFSEVKNQYVYRCIYFTEGSVNVELCGEALLCEKGDLLFLVPGEEYRFYPTESVSLINVSFDLISSLPSEGRNVSGCVYKSEFTPSLCSKKPRISDGEALKHNRLFKGIKGSHIFTELLSADRDTVYFELFAKISLSNILYNILTDEDRKKNEKATRIVSYINLNATEDLSPSHLEEKFGYHRNHINRLVKQQTGRTLTQVIRRSKINYAKSMITEAKMPQSQIAEELGYYDYSHFYKAFVNETGMSPSDMI